MTMGQLTDILVPHIGDFDAVEIIEIAVQPGDRVKPEDTLLTLESEKATMDIPSPAAGTVRELMVNVGDAVAQGALILKLEQDEPQDEVSPDDDNQGMPAAAEKSGTTTAGTETGTEKAAESVAEAPEDRIAGTRPETGAQDPGRRTDHRLKCILQGSCQSGGA